MLSGWRAGPGAGWWPAASSRLAGVRSVGSRWPARIVCLALVAPVAALGWVVAQVAGVVLILAGWSPPLTLAGIEALTVPTSTTRASVTVPDDRFRLGPDGRCIDPVDQLRYDRLTGERDIEARHRLLDRIEAIQVREAAPVAARAKPVFRPVRFVRALVVTGVLAAVCWWLFVFVAAAGGSYSSHLNGPHGVPIPGATTSSTR
jgi:hypothetical protein